MLFGFLKRFFSISSSKTPVSKQDKTKTLADIPVQRDNKIPSSELVSLSTEDYRALATSFNDFLLGENNHLAVTEPNDIELYIINNLEAMLHGEIPESAVPRLPDVAMILLKELTDINISKEAIMSQIIRDPVLASEVLKMSNSALFRTNNQEKIVNLEKAVIILGLENLKTIVSSVLMKRLVLIAPVYFRMFGQHLWQHSLDCGQACRALAKFYGQADPNNAYLVGLMHDIGKLAIFGLLTKALGQSLDYKPRGVVFSGIIRDHSQNLSAKIADKWALPDYLLTALNEQVDDKTLGDCSVYGFILNQANILAEFKPIAERQVKAGESLNALLVQYSIPLQLFQEAYPETYLNLQKANHTRLY